MGAKIMVIDDDPKITALLQRILSYEGYVVETANDGFVGLEMIKKNQPELLILDVMMPGIDGFEICSILRRENVTPILILSARDEVENRVKGLNLGADDYLAKPFDLEELLARVQALLRRRYQNNQVLQFADLKLDLTTREVRRNNKEISLTAREYDLLNLFMQHPHQVFSKNAILDKVWGLDYNGASNVLEVYINMLRQKMEETNKSRLIQTIRGVGYVLKEEGK